MEALRGESSAFSAFGLDNITTPIKEISQRIAIIELKTEGIINNAVELPNYVIVKPHEGKDLMYVDYWSTLAEAANNLKAGSKLQQFSGSNVRADAIFLLTATTGGRSRLKADERLNAFKYGLMTRNRIITREDISNFCCYELGSRVTGVTVTKGFEMSAHPSQGFNRTIDVTISPSTTAQNHEEWQILCEELRLKLQTRSGMSNHYRVFVKEAGE